MIAALHYFFLVDEKARWRAIMWSWLIGTGTGAIVSLSDASYPVLASASIGSSIIAFTFFLAAHIHSPRPERIRGRRSILNVAYAVSALAVFAILERILDGPQAVYAAAKEFAKNMRAGQTVSTAQALVIQEKARSILAQNQIRGLSRSRVVSAYAIAKAALQYSTTKVDVPRPPNTDVIFSGHRTHLIFQPPSPMVMFNSGCHSRMTNIDFTARVKGCTLLSVNPGCRDTVVADALVQDFTQTLDDIVWIDVVFERCALAYQGGQLTLTNVELRGCTVDFSPTVPQNIREVLLRPSTPIATTSEFPN